MSLPSEQTTLEEARRAMRRAYRRKYRQTPSYRAERARYYARKRGTPEYTLKRQIRRVKYSESARQYLRRPVVSMVRCARNRARALGLPFNLRVRDIVIPTHCPILGIPLIRCLRNGQSSSHSPSLDRIVPELGYVRGNVQVISLRANQIKSDASTAEVYRVAANLQVVLHPGHQDGEGI